MLKHQGRFGGFALAVIVVVRAVRDLDLSFLTFREKPRRPVRVQANRAQWGWHLGGLGFGLGLDRGLGLGLGLGLGGLGFGGDLGGLDFEAVLVMVLAGLLVFLAWPLHPMLLPTASCGINAAVFMR